ncbi:ribosomal protein L7/L12 [Pricia sp. S334]|uniref:Ribosomal protein L7/L12 n=1 Tax=Pricia mediterranea TaxID=3076079 RepID=A0ABU3L080_9FLAO|nr:ribosomal protein L7/L12 [Pricia sp. S334]MDT7827137.1 ribosomal protein L7/L12 [Pricia sp. S334]
MKTFKITIQPAKRNTLRAIMAMLKRMLGTESTERIEELARSGGVVLEGLFQESAADYARKLREVGAVVEIEEVKTEEELFLVRLISYGTQKIQVIKAVRDLTGLGLKESKKIVDELGMVGDNLDSKSASRYKRILEDAGATVSLEPISESDDPKTIEAFAVFGNVKLANGEPAGGLLVRAYDRDLRSRELLGEATTKVDGNYQISYTSDDFKKAEKNRADLTVQVFNEIGTLIQANSERKEIIFNAKQVEEVNLIVREAEPTRPSEYERLVAMLNPLLDGAALSSLTDEEVNFLVHESEITEFEHQFPAGAQSISFLVQSIKLSEETDIPPEAFYGWAREDAGVMREENSIHIKLGKLLELDNKELSNKLHAAVERFIVPATLLENLENILEQLDGLRKTQGLLFEHLLKGKLVDDKNGNPAIGYGVKAFDSESENTLFHTTQTNQQGNFTVPYITSSEEPGTDNALLLRVYDLNGEEILQKEIASGQVDTLEFKVSIPEPPKPELPGENKLLTDLNDETDFDISGDLLGKLEELEVKTFNDFRKLGTNGQLESLSNDFGEETIHKLKAYADLSVVSDDITISKALIDNGYASPLQIADTPKHKFVEHNKGNLGKTRALQLANASRAATTYLDSAMTGAVLEIDRNANTNEFPEIREDILDILPEPKCNCGCNHALSPNAYLADLMDYITTHLDLKGSEQLTLEFLHERFHQPFDRFPNSCSFMTAEVRKVRICVEVLRHYLDQNPPQDSGSLSKAIKDYVFETYTLLLQQLGASYEEVQLADSDVQLRETLAERLGILPVRLQGSNLLLIRQSLTEFSLQRVFGLKTTDKPLQIMEGEPSYLTWQYDKLSQVWLDQDHPLEGGRDYPIIDPDLVYSSEIKSTGPALTLQRQRKGFVSRFKQEMQGKPKDLNGLDEILQEALSTSRTEITEVHALFGEGHDISDFLDGRGIAYPGFNIIVKSIKALEASNDVSDSQWDSIHHIAVRAKKQSKFEEWKREEKDASITLSPDFFVFKRRDFTVAIEEEPALQWLLSPEQRRLWENTLKARLDQKETLSMALESTVGTVEEQMLPSLRDALIGISNAEGTTLEEKAEWVTEQLQIDARTSGCAMTTRVSQAITTLQNLVFSIRTGQLDASVADFKALPDSFDTDWKWMGSYATWKAATAVYLFPENVLRPNLRVRKTSGFYKILESINSSANIDPEKASEFAIEYRDYFESVCNLIVEASCWAYTGIKDNTNLPRAKKLLFTFARPKYPGRNLYWSAYNPKAANFDYAQSYWQPLPDTQSDGDVVGVNYFNPIEGENRICIFFLKRDYSEGRLKLGVKHYSIEDLGKPKPLITLDLEDYMKDVSVRVVQRTISSVPPKIIVQSLNNNEIYQRSLNDSANGWSKDEDWQLIYSRDIINQNIKITLDEQTVGDELSFSTRISINNIRIPFYLKVLIGGGRYAKSIGGRLEAAFERDSEITLILRGTATIQILKYEVKRYGTGRTIKLTKDMVPANQLDHFEKQAFEKLNHEIATITIPGSKVNLEINQLISINSNDINSVYGTDFQHVFWGVRRSGSVSRKVYVKSLAGGVKQETDSGLAIIPPLDGSSEDNILVYQKHLGDNSFGLYAGKYANGDFDHTIIMIPEQVKYYSITNMATSAMSSVERNNKIQLSYLFNIANRVSRHIPWSNLDYLAEAYYFVPILVAQTLQENGYFEASLDWYRSVYDYGLPQSNQKQVYPHSFLERGTAESQDFNRSDDWFEDPLNPHSIASSRKNAYLKFTLYGLIECLIEYADEQFTYDTPESLAKARTLYVTALELMEHEVLKKEETECNDLVIDILNAIDDPDDRDFYYGMLKPALKQLSKNKVAALAEDTVTVYEADLSEDVKIAKIKELVNENIEGQTTDTYKEVAAKNQKSRWKTFDLLSTHERFAGPLTDIRNTVFINGSGRDFEIPEVSDTLDFGPTDYVTKANFSFCIPANPVLDRLRMRASLNLEKLRTCRNIAGLQREVEFYETSIGVDGSLPSIGASGKITLPSTSSQPPTLYRYSVLMNRAKEFANLAQQIESAYLSALQGKEAELYSQLKARQDLDLSKAGVRLQDLRVDQAVESVTLAELQKDSAEIQVGHYQNLIIKGLLQNEKQALELMRYSQLLPDSISVSFPLGVSASKSPSGIVQTEANIKSTYASYERREQEWRFAKQLAEQDTRIGRQQIQIAESSLEITDQERSIAVLQTDHAETTLDFLVNKDLNADLYRWMSGILRKVYAFFLQQATAIAFTAERQLAFERQEGIAGYIQNNYWNAIEGSAQSSAFEENGSTDRLGLTGSARLMQDLYRLDQYAFDTEERKQQLSVNISLARLDPFAFQQFRESGVLPFDTPQELFDRRFPGQYLRLIKRVRVSLIALVPPVEGISATLQSTGISRVVIGHDIFQKKVIRREPETISFTSPSNASGIFELNPNPEMLLPFEGNGVDTRWEFSLPKASNNMDYNSIADVIFTIEYTALYNATYKKQVEQELDRYLEADRAFSFRQEFADAWYDLNNPDLTDTPMSVAFETMRADFSANSKGLNISQILLYFISDEKLSEMLKAELTFIQNGNTMGGEATPIDGIVSTRRGNGSSWIPITGHNPEGKWQLSMPDNQDIKNLFTAEKIKDILFVITYSGQSPEWPS